MRVPTTMPLAVFDGCWKIGSFATLMPLASGTAEQTTRAVGIDAAEIGEIAAPRSSRRPGCRRNCRSCRAHPAGCPWRAGSARRRSETSCSLAAVVRADWINWARTSAMSRLTRSTPWKMLTSDDRQQRDGDDQHAAAGAASSRDRGTAVARITSGAPFPPASPDSGGVSRSSCAMISRAASPSAGRDTPSSVSLAVQDFHQRLAGARHPAFDRADGAFADRGRVLIGKSARAHQDQRLALFVGQAAQRARRVGQLGGIDLVLAAARNALGRILVPGRLAPGPAPVGIELIAQDGEQPGLEIGARG